MSKNTKLSQFGFSHVLIFMAVIVVVVIGFAGWRVMNKSVDKSDNSTNNTSTETTNNTANEPDLILSNLGLASLDSVLVDQNAVREFASKGLKGFYIFGDKLSGGRTNPNFEYASLKDGTKVVSAIDGVVAFIKQQAANDNEVFIQPKDGSMWTIGYDHLTNLAVKKGDSVKVGAVLGEPVMQNNGQTRFEFQINKDEKGVTTHYCPTTLLAPGVKDKLLADLTALQNDWEKVTGLELYEITAQNPVGCTKTTMSVSEAEGR